MKDLEITDANDLSYRDNETEREPLHAREFNLVRQHSRSQSPETETGKASRKKMSRVKFSTILDDRHS